MWWSQGQVSASLVRAAGIAALMTVVIACGAQTSGRAGKPPSHPLPTDPRKPNVTASQDISGVWDWTVEAQNEDGDTRTEREEWHLTQQGKKVRGYYDRVLTVLSGDGRPFECYQDTRYQKFTRFRVVGEIEGAAVHIRETDYQTSPDPCDPGRRKMTTYVGRVEGATLMLSWPPSGIQVLRRRHAQAPGRETTVPATASGDETPVAASGVWEWSWHAVDANGDERVEREEWHLWQQGGTVRGYYDRTLRGISGSGKPWPCSGKPEYHVAMRFELTGQVLGRHLQLSETGATQTAGAPCTLPVRPATLFEGEMGVENMLVSSGHGSRREKHVLHRVRPQASFPEDG